MASFSHETAAAVSSGQVKLGAGIPNLAALGADRVEDLLLEKGGRLVEEDRKERVEQDELSTTWRIPFPGTPDASGNFTRPPRGAGTGWMLVRRYERISYERFMLARWRKPRSGSLAAREWNLFCAMRSAGLSTLEPLAIANSKVAGMAGLMVARSAIVFRAPERLLPLIQVDLSQGEFAEATREAVREAVEALSEAGFYLPRLSSRTIWVSHRRPGVEACGEDEPPLPGLALNPRPSVVFTDVREGRMSGGKLSKRKAQMQRDALADTLRAS